MAKLIAYYRVSTDKQGKSGLGLEGQQAAVEAYASRAGATILRAYTEVESDKRSDRPELAKALAHAKRSRATLIVAKLDRLARNVHFLSGLMQSGVDFVCCDNPNANRLTIHILAAVAEDEAVKISERTRAALQAKKGRGEALGTPANLSAEGMAKGRKLGSEAVRTKAGEAYADLAPMLAEMRAGGLSLRAIADRLNAEGHTTRRGKPWSPMQVSRVLGRSSGLRQM